MHCSMQSLVGQDHALLLFFGDPSLSEIRVTHKIVLSVSTLVFEKKKNVINHGSIQEVRKKNVMGKKTSLMKTKSSGK